LISLLPDDNTTPHFVLLSTLATLPVESRSPGRPRRWTKPPTESGNAPANAALAEVYRLLISWLADRYVARAPVVIHCTDGEGLDVDYVQTALSLELLATSNGQARLVHCGWTSPTDAAPWEMILPVSAPLANGGRALTVNEWPLPMVWDLVFDNVDDEPREVKRPSTKAFAVARTFWCPKLGNSPTEWEDAFAVDSETGTATICDGASEGIFCRVWADLLARRATAERPDFSDGETFAKWVASCRTGWREAIQYPNLRWSQQHRVDSVGAATTMLNFRVGEPDGTGVRPWRAAAVGDACLFWIRDGRLLATFPVAARDQFGSAPSLIRSDPAYEAGTVIAEGNCQAEDKFLLATDAVAARLFAERDWRRYEQLPESEWLAEMDSARQSGEMVNDDWTLIVLIIASHDYDEFA
jgi:hypothetical protein